MSKFSTYDSVLSTVRRLPSIGSMPSSKFLPHIKFIWGTVYFYQQTLSFFEDLVSNIDDLSMYIRDEYNQDTYVRDIDKAIAAWDNLLDIEQDFFDTYNDLSDYFGTNIDDIDKDFINTFMQQRVDQFGQEVISEEITRLFTPAFDLWRTIGSEAISVYNWLPYAYEYWDE